MGKKKGAGTKRAFKKDPVATKVAVGVKKTKTKAVSINLKKMNFQNRAQTEAVDAEFSQLQQLRKRSQTTGGTPQGGAAGAGTDRIPQAVSARTKPKPAEVEEEADTDMAVEEEFSKLVSVL